MPMQATTTAPLFSAALKPDNSPRLTGGWIAFAIAAVLASPLAVLEPTVLIPAAIAFGIGGMVLTVLSLRHQRRSRVVEHVTLWPDQLEISVLDETGQKKLRRFDPNMVRLVLRRDDNEKALAIQLRAGSELVELGRFLKAEDRASFARAFGTALRKARQTAE